MTKLAQFLMAGALVVPMAVYAQSSTPATSSDPLPAAPGAAPAAATTTTIPGGGNKIGTINIEQAIIASNEGQRDFEALSKKLEPKQTELKNMNDEVDSLKKQLNTQGDKLNEESRAALVKQIEEKQKKLDRSVQDARDDAQAQQNEIAQRILQKMAPLVVKYAQDNGFGVIIDTSNPWPNGPVLWSALDMTKPVVDAYNVQSGVPAPPRPAGSTGGAATGARPAGSASKPAGTMAPATKPASSTAPPK